LPEARIDTPAYQTDEPAPQTDNRSERTTPERLAVVFAGGVGLGVYQAGVYAALHEVAALRLDWLAGSSIGAVNAAVVAGNPPERRIERLRALWLDGENTKPHATGHAAPSFGTARHLQNWASALQTRLIGRTGHFHPRYLTRPFGPYSSIYDLSPLRARIERLVDFGRLNSGEVRMCVAATDLETGDPVLFDTGEGTRITADHLLASCGYLPEFAPVEIDGRLLGDGGLSINAPIEAVLLGEEPGGIERACFVVDLFSRDGERPVGLQAALTRKNDLLLANQTFMRLEAYRRESGMRDHLARSGAGTRSSVRAVCYLSYRAATEEAGPEKVFDLSLATMSDRWHAGALDAREAIRRLSLGARPEHGWALHVIRR
jgi:NTE family protein